MRLQLDRQQMLRVRCKGTWGPKAKLDILSTQDGRERRSSATGDQKR